MSKYSVGKRPWLGVKLIHPKINGWQHWARYAQWVKPVWRRRRRRGQLSRYYTDSRNTSIPGLYVTDQTDGPDPYGYQEIEIPTEIRIDNRGRVLYI